MGASSWAGWKPVPVLGSPGPVGRGCNLAPQRPGPRLPPQSRTMAAPIGHASLDTSPITLYLCFTLLFFFSLLLLSHSGGGKGYNIFIFIIPNLCEAFNKTLFPHSQGY